jgi:hypothetical protein
VTHPAEGVLGRALDEEEARRVVAQHPGAQLRGRAVTREVPAMYAVFVNGEQHGDAIADPGEAAKAAKAVGGNLRLVPQT